MAKSLELQATLREILKRLILRDKSKERSFFISQRIVINLSKRVNLRSIKASEWVLGTWVINQGLVTQIL